MGYHIIMDSVGDRTEELLEMENFSLVALSIMIDGKEVLDDGTLGQEEILKKVKEAKACPRSACASPNEYYKLFEKYRDKRIYLVSASSGGTGAYNSAKVGEDLFKEKYPESKVEIFDSKSASAGQTLLVYKIIEFEERYKDFKLVSENLRKFMDKQKTLCLIEDITYLRHNGRITGVKALLASALSIVPILQANEKGELVQKTLTRGVRRAIRHIKKLVVGGVETGKKQMLVISHCNCAERAANMKDGFLEYFPDLDIKIVKTGGLATFYAGDGGVIISY